MALGEELMECAIGGNAYGARPLSIGDIDDHPDSARIWATILAIREGHFGLSEAATEEAIANAQKDWQESVISDFEDELGGYRIAVSMKDADTGLFHMGPIRPPRAKHQGVDLEFLRDEIEASLTNFLERESETIAEALGEAGEDLAEFNASRAEAVADHAERVKLLRDHISRATAEAKMESYDRRVLRSGRPDAKLLSRLKKEDLVRLTEMALSIAYGHEPR